MRLRLEPTLHENDFISIDRTLPIDETQVGEIIVFASPSNHPRALSPWRGLQIHQTFVGSSQRSGTLYPAW